MRKNLNRSLPKAKFSNEAKFTTWRGGELKKRGGHFHKISDLDISIKPYDAVFAWDGVVGGIEFKFTRAGSCYPFRMLRGSSIKKQGGQVKGLRGMAANLGYGLVIVYSYKCNNYKVFNIKELDFDTHYKFTCSTDLQHKTVM